MLLVLWRYLLLLVSHVYFSSLYLFFFKQKTAYEMRISDWSSDVCSSDLDSGRLPIRGRASEIPRMPKLPRLNRARYAFLHDVIMEIGRASCRERVCQYV